MSLGFRVIGALGLFGSIYFSTVLPEHSSFIQPSGPLSFMLVGAALISAVMILLSFVIKNK